MTDRLGETAHRARAVRFEAPRRIGVVGVDVRAPRDDEVLVRTLWSGISGGTEMLAYRGELDPRVPVDEVLGSLGGTFSYPFQYGYSCVGRVEEASGHLEPGQNVFAFHPHQDLFVVPLRDVVAIDDVDPRLATLFPLVETATQVTLDVGPVLGVPIVVMGLGAVGLLSALVLQQAGALVLASEPVAWRRTVAAAMGIDAVPPVELAPVVEERTAGHGVPLVVEVSGNPDALGEGLGLLAHEGEVLVASWYGTKQATLPLGAAFHRRRLRIRSTQVSTIPSALAARWTVERRRAKTRRLLDELPLALLATHEFSFARAAEAFAAVERGDAGLVHAALCYD